MNFGMVRNVKNQKDAQGYPLRLAMFAMLNEIGGIQANAKGTTFAKAKLTDDAGETHNVTLYNAVPPPQLLNSRQPFSLSCFDGNFQGKPYTGYSGFWQDGAGQQPQQQAAKSYQPPKQGPAPKQDKPDWEAISRGKVRHGVVCAFIQSGQEPDIPAVEYWVDYIMTGENPNWPDGPPSNPREPGQDDGPPPSDDEIPF